MSAVPTGPEQANGRQEEQSDLNTTLSEGGAFRLRALAEEIFSPTQAFRTKAVTLEDALRFIKETTGEGYETRRVYCRDNGISVDALEEFRDVYLNYLVSQSTLSKAAPDNTIDYSRSIWNLTYAGAQVLFERINNIRDKGNTLEKALFSLNVPKAAYMLLDQYRDYLHAADPKEPLVLKPFKGADARIALSVLSEKIKASKSKLAQPDSATRRFEGEESFAELISPEPGAKVRHLKAAEQQAVLAYLEGIELKFGRSAAQLLIIRYGLQDRVNRWTKSRFERQIKQSVAKDDRPEPQGDEPADEPDPKQEGFVPTNAWPGSAEKLEVLVERRAKGLPLWHEDDRTDMEHLYAYSLELFATDGKAMNSVKKR